MRHPQSQGVRPDVGYPFQGRPEYYSEPRGFHNGMGRNGVSPSPADVDEESDRGPDPDIPGGVLRNGRIDSGPDPDLHGGVLKPSSDSLPP